MVLERGSATNVGSTRESTSALDWAQWTLGYINLGVNNIQSTKGCVRGSGDTCTYATSKASRVLAVLVFNFAQKGLVAGENVDVRAYRQKPGPADLYQNSRGRLQRGMHVRYIAKATCKECALYDTPSRWSGVHAYGCSVGVAIP